VCLERREERPFHRPQSEALKSLTCKRSDRFENANAQPSVVQIDEEVTKSRWGVIEEVERQDRFRFVPGESGEGGKGGEEREA
jgi:hypothetical protein